MEDGRHLAIFLWLDISILVVNDSDMRKKVSRVILLGSLSLAL